MEKIKKLGLKKIIIILLVLAFIPFTPTLSRYVYNGIKNYYLTSKNFYFNCDKLAQNIARYQLDNWSGVEPITIVFNMDSINNNKIASESNIDYEIDYSCSTNVTCTISKTEGTIYTNTHQDSFTVTMSPNTTLHGGDNVWLDISATSTEPYTKKISGFFRINVGEIGLSYEIVDAPHQPYFDFNITNTLDYYKVEQAFDSYSAGDHIDIADYQALSDDKKAKCHAAIITLDFDPTLFRLDMTNTNYLNKLSESTTTIGGFVYINSFRFKVDALSSASVRFYKMNPSQDYTYPYVNSSSVVTFDAR